MERLLAQPNIIRRGLAAGGLALAMISGTTACLPHEVLAAQDFCSAQPDTMKCLGSLAQLHEMTSFSEGGQVIDHNGVMAAAGIAPEDFAAVETIVPPESGWCFTKWQGQIGYCPDSYQPKNGNPRNEQADTGFGLCQSTPPIKMAAAGEDWRVNPVTQLEWCSSYAKARYGGWRQAAAHWRANHNW